MKIKNDNRGMTLIEMIVVLLISTIIMAMVGGMILYATGFFQRETVASQDKEGLDDIATFVRKELTYVTGVYIGENPPDNQEWSSLYVEDGVLYKDGVLLLEEEYYGGRRLNMTIRSYDDYRLDMYFQYVDTNQQDIYNTKTAIELVNVKLLLEKGEEELLFTNMEEAVTVSVDSKIYYIKDISKLPDTEEDTTKTDVTGVATGLVGSQVAFIDNTNNMGVYNPAVKYTFGEFVYYDGVWYKKLSSYHDNHIIPGRYWKKIDDEYDHNSAYEAGDIVIYNGKYYQTPIDRINSNHEYPTHESWNEVDQETMESNVYENKYPVTLVTPLNKLDGTKVETIPIYNSSQTYGQGAYVKIPVSGTNNELYTYYYLADDSLAGTPGKRDENGENGWMTLSRMYDDQSYYEKGSVVRFEVLSGWGDHFNLQATIDIKVTTTVNFNNSALPDYKSWDIYGS